MVVGLPAIVAQVSGRDETKMLEKREAVFEMPVLDETSTWLRTRRPGVRISPGAPSIRDFRALVLKFRSCAVSVGTVPARNVRRCLRAN
jgi:hypothetical protein